LSPSSGAEQLRLRRSSTPRTGSHRIAVKYKSLDASAEFPVPSCERGFHAALLCAAWHGLM
jgi:hypothetical protein